MQLVAMISMIIDHIGLVFFPDHPFWRIIGRIAFPLYTFGIVQGLRYTSSRKKYLVRLAVIGLIAQVPYSLLINPLQINVIGTFIIVLLALQLLERAGDYKWMITVALTTWILFLLPFEYGSYALLLALIYYYLPRHKHLIVLAHIALNGYIHLLLGWDIQHYSIIATLLIVYGVQLLDLISRLRIPRWIWRSFYPAHLAILVVIKAI